MAEDRIYFCIDMKSFYASVECAERGLNPFETDLAVADASRGEGGICLAITPRMKQRGIRNRCRLYEIPEALDYIVALPRMQLYIEYAADIYAIYLKYFDPRDMHVYSIDETFIDVTDYLKVYHTQPRELAKKLMNEIASTLHIPSTAGIGTNLFLAKVALDISAKHTEDHMGYLTEELFRETLWEHEPITDFWQIASGTARRLWRYGIHNMRGVAQAPEALLYKEFGVNAELLIDHAWGRESCRMEDIKNYTTKSRSVSFSQILPRDYSFEEARVVMREMVLHGCHELMKRGVITKTVAIGIGYSKAILPSTHGQTHLTSATAVSSLMTPPVLELFDAIARREVPIRRLSIDFPGVVGEQNQGYDFFTDWEAVEKEKQREKTVLALAEKYGRNAVLRGTNFLEGATQRERNEMIGGHRAGYDETGTGKAIHALRRDEGPAGGAAGPGGAPHKGGTP